MNTSEFEKRNVVYRWTPTEQERILACIPYSHKEYALIKTENEGYLIPYARYNASVRDTDEWVDVTGQVFLWKLAFGTNL